MTYIASRKLKFFKHEIYLNTNRYGNETKPAANRSWFPPHYIIKDKKSYNGTMNVHK